MDQPSNQEEPASSICSPTSEAQGGNIASKTGSLLDTRTTSAGSLADLSILVSLLIVVVVSSCYVGQLLGGEPHFNKAATAGILVLLGVGLSYLPLLLPSHPIEFIGRIYFATMIRMAVPLLGAIVMRQIGTPLFSKSWVGYILAFYGIGLLAETIIVVKALKTTLPK